jgi:Ca2+-binding EF-hand superfamily protein
MSLSEFITTLNYALSFISIVPTEEQLTWLFNDIDRNRDGVISYQEYFEFLRYYFGSQSEAAQTGGEEVVVKRKVREEGGVAEERFSKLIRAQARVLFMGFDVNRNVMFERSEASQLLNNLLKHTSQ